MDYEKTFAHMAKMTIIHTFIVVLSILHCHISHRDIKNDFLNGYLYEEVWVVPLLGVSHN